MRRGASSYEDEEIRRRLALGDNGAAACSTNDCQWETPHRSLGRLLPPDEMETARVYFGQRRRSGSQKAILLPGAYYNLKY